MKKITITLFILVSSVFSMPLVYAQDSADDLKKQVAELKERVAQLEAQKEAAVVRWPDPAAEFSDMQNKMDELFQGPEKDGAFFSDPGFQLEEAKDGYTVTVDISQFDQDKIDVIIGINSITVKAQSNKESKTAKSDGGYIKSHSYGSFLRTIPLPTNADTAKAKIKKEAGTLIITLPKTP